MKHLMKTKMVLGLIAVAVLSIMFVGESYAASGNGIGVVESPGTSYTFTFSGEGQSEYVEGHGIASLSDRDTYVITLTTKLTITIVLADGYIMGDTIAIFYPSSTKVGASAKSPKIVVVTVVLNAGTYTFWVGYTSCPGGFPAGYFMWIIATHG